MKLFKKWILRKKTNHQLTIYGFRLIKFVKKCYQTTVWLKKSSFFLVIKQPFGKFAVVIIEIDRKVIYASPENDQRRNYH